MKREERHITECGGRKEIKHYSDSAPFPPYSTTISKGASGTTTAHHSADMSQKKNCLTIPAGVHATIFFFFFFFFFFFSDFYYYMETNKSILL